MPGKPSPISGPFEVHDGLGALKKLTVFQRLLVPAMKTSSSVGHFSKRAMNGLPSLSIPASATVNDCPPFVVLNTNSSWAEIAQSVSGRLKDTAFEAPSPTKSESHESTPFHFAVALSWL